MAAELQIDAQQATGGTVYFLLRNTTGSIWNGSSFVTYVDADIANYDIAATEQGTASGYFVGTMPGVAAGVYNVVAKQRAGGSPAVTDFSIGWGAIQWTGSAVLPLSGVPNGTTNLNAIADTILKRDVDTVEGTAAIHSLCGAILKLVSKFDVKDASNSNAATTYKTNGTDIFMTQSPTTNASLVPVQSLDVAS